MDTSDSRDRTGFATSSDHLFLQGMYTICYCEQGCLESRWKQNLFRLVHGRVEPESNCFLIFEECWPRVILAGWVGVYFFCGHGVDTWLSWCMMYVEGIRICRIYWMIWIKMLLSGLSAWRRTHRHTLAVWTVWGEVLRSVSVEFASLATGGGAFPTPHLAPLSRAPLRFVLRPKNLAIHLFGSTLLPCWLHDIARMICVISELLMYTVHQIHVCTQDVFT